MADVRLRHGWLWIGLLVLLLAGAGLITSDDARLVGTGIALLLAPLVASLVLLTVFYIQSRRQA